MSDAEVSPFDKERARGWLANALVTPRTIPNPSSPEEAN